MSKTTAVNDGINKQLFHRDELCPCAEAAVDIPSATSPRTRQFENLLPHHRVPAI